MRAVLQRVRHASVSVEGHEVAAIGPGLLVLLGVGHGDDEGDLTYLVEKIPGLRIFEDAAGKMNLSLLDTSKQLLVVSQFTLFADTRKGKRPSFVDAMEPEGAKRAYLAFCERCRLAGCTVKEGVFAADMQVALVNDGPVTILLDSKARASAG
jgi:D-aminoacyl-tRNA deacylase